MAEATRPDLWLEMRKAALAPVEVNFSRYGAPGMIAAVCNKSPILGLGSSRYMLDAWLGRMSLGPALRFDCGFETTSFATAALLRQFLVASRKAAGGG